MLPPPVFSCFFFFNDTATTEIYTLSLHDALPICLSRAVRAEQADNLAPLDVERDRVDDLPALEPFHEPLRHETFHRSVPAGLRRPTHGRLAVPLVLVAGIEDRLDPLLLATLDDGPVLRDEERDRVAGHDVVLFPDPGVADEHHPLLEVEVLRALRRPGPAVFGDDPDAPGRDRSQNPVSLLVEVDLDPVGVLDGVVPACHDVAAEDDEVLLAEPFRRRSRRRARGALARPSRVVAPRPANGARWFRAAGRRSR